MSDSQVENCNGFRFCKDCGKLCIPLRVDLSEPNVMLFKCETCEDRICTINIRARDDQSEVADIKSKALGEDPSMPRKNMFCRY